MSSWRRLRRHDPEGDAAAYLAGDMPPRFTRAFEEHLLACEDCWREVRTARRGRAVAEAARELAPVSLREDLRGAVALSRPPEQRGFQRVRVPLALALAGLILAAGGYALDRLVTAGHPQPAAIAAALDSFRSDRIPAEGPAVRAAPDLSEAGLQLMLSGRGVMGGQPVDVYYYRGPSGTRLFLFESGRTFPRARSARDVSGPGNGWEATADDVSILCGDHPIPYLVLGNQASRVAAASSILESGSVT